MSCLICQAAVVSFRNGRVISLMEILRAYAHEFVQITMNLGTSIQDLVHQEKGDIWSDDDHRSCLMAVLLQLDKLCGSAELSVTQKLTQQIIDQMKLGEDNLGARKYFDNALLCDYLHQLRPRFMDELET